MSALHESASSLDRSFGSLMDLLREELAPYPFRAAIVARIVISSVIVMLLVMTFHVPGAALAGYYTLLLSRESPRATLAGAVELVASFGAGVGYVLLSSLLFFGSPVLHFLWVIVSFFIIFLGIRVLRSYSAAAGFGFLIATCIPLWDRPQPSELSVEATLWTAGSVALGAIVTVTVEYLSAPFRRQEAWQQELLDRWRIVRQSLDALAADDSPGANELKLTQMAAVGVSRLRRTILRSGGSVDFIERTGAIISITEQLVDLTASLVQVHQRSPYEETQRLRHVSLALERVERRFLFPGASHDSTSYTPNEERMVPGPPLVPEIERTVFLLENAITEEGSKAISQKASPSAEKLPLFVRDAWSNPGHLHFALKGCLAASLCYIVYNAVGWPGLNTAVATCIVTALSSVGSSRQKQILRISGAIVGGVVFGMGAQVFLLPSIDSITGFTLLFGVVTAIAAWFSTASARLSYFGLQIALAFFLINLQEFTFQTSLTIARDRVLGILLGLFVMWLTFDLLDGVRAVDQMTARFKQSLERLAELQELSFATDASTLVDRVQTVRESLIGIFAAVNTEGDAVLLETGPRRTEDLAVRRDILALQPALRSILLLQVTLLQYRNQKLLHELPPPIAEAQRAFDETIAKFLRQLAADYPGRPAVPAFARFGKLREAVHQYYEQTSTRDLSAAALAVLSLSDSIAWTIETLELSTSDGTKARPAATA